MEHLLGTEKLQRTVKCKHWIKPGATKTVATVGQGAEEVKAQGQLWLLYSPRPGISQAPA